jgi:carboxypeptidase Taq
MMSTYQQLEQHYGTLGKLWAANSLLFWDRNVVMKPGSAAVHGEVASAMAAVHAEKATDPRIEHWLGEAEAERSRLDAWQAANLTEMRRLYRHASAVPTELKIRQARLGAEMSQAWQKARAENDFGSFAPYMRQMVELVREIAGHKAVALGLKPYDALMDEYDPGVNSELVDGVFGALKLRLPALLEQVLDKQAGWNLLPLGAGHPDESQRELCEFVMRKTGYHFDHGRLDQTSHPFALAGVPGDQRITTRFKADDLRFGLMATIHETGHSFYEYNLPRQYSFQPVGAARGTSLHESQSLMLEMFACRSAEFVRFLAPELAKRFGAADPAYAYDNVLKHYHKIRRNLIRTEADQIVYPLHVILRYEIELLLLDGSLPIDELPEFWNTRMKQLIGVTPPDAGQGCLQDIHWSFGMFGYFPSYAIGAAIAAQLFETATAADPLILDGLIEGDFGPFFAWVKPNVHEKASSLTIQGIVEQATGAPLSAEPLLRHLTQRYG